MNKYPVEMNCLLSLTEYSAISGLYYFEKLSFADLQSWFTSRFYIDALSILKSHGRNSVEFIEELKSVIVLEIKRMRREMIEACGNVYKDLLNLGYTTESLNRPFSNLIFLNSSLVPQ
jgi:hypothetical protein